MITIEENLKRLKEKYTELGFAVAEISRFNLASDTLSFHKRGSPAIVSFVSEFLEEALTQTDSMESIKQEVSA